MFEESVLPDPAPGPPRPVTSLHGGVMVTQCGGYGRSIAMSSILEETLFCSSVIFL